MAVDIALVLEQRERLLAREAGLCLWLQVAKGRGENDPISLHPTHIPGDSTMDISLNASLFQSQWDFCGYTVSILKDSYPHL